MNDTSMVLTVMLMASIVMMLFAYDKLKQLSETLAMIGRKLLTGELVIKRYDDDYQELDSPTSGLSLPGGEVSMRIIYRNVVVPAGRADQNITKTRVYTQVDGSDVPQIQEIAGNGGTVDIIVPEKASGQCWFTYVDGSENANESPRSPVTRFELANDQTPPDAPEGGLALPLGDSIPDV